MASYTGEDIAAADSLADLGIETTEDYREARDVWYRYQTDRLPGKRGYHRGGAPDVADAALTALPSDYIPDVDGVDYTVVGIAHGLLPEETDTDAFQLDDRSTAYIQHELNQVNDRTPVFLEDNFQRMVDLDNDEQYQMPDLQWAITRLEDKDVTLPSWVTAPLPDRSLWHTLGLLGTGLGELIPGFPMDELYKRSRTLRQYEEELFSRLSLSRADLNGALQTIQKKRQLPEPLERAWQEREDAVTALILHERSEFMADYAVDTVPDDADDAVIVIGAGHLPGIRHYLAQHRDVGKDTVDGFDQFTPDT